MSRRARFTLAVMVLTAAALLVAAPVAGAAPPGTWTVIRHNVTTSQHFPDDICGPRAVTETLTNTTEVQHLTANADGSFHFVDFETGIMFVDYDDPATPDQTMRRTETFEINLTPGGTYTETNTSGRPTPCSRSAPPTTSPWWTTRQRSSTSLSSSEAVHDPRPEGGRSGATPPRTDLWPWPQPHRGRR